MSVDEATKERIEFIRATYPTPPNREAIGDVAAVAVGDVQFLIRIVDGLQAELASAYMVRDHAISGLNATATRAGRLVEEIRLARAVMEAAEELRTNIRLAINTANDRYFGAEVRPGGVIKVSTIRLWDALDVAKAGRVSADSSGA